MLEASKHSSINSKWVDRERVMLLCSRGSLARTRHLVNDLKKLMPNAHGESKYGKNGNMAEDLNEMCELANCTKCLYFESRKGRDIYLWLSNVDGGPSAKFLVRNMHTMNELNMVGNCLKGSRPILSFDPEFDGKSHLRLVKELLANAFKTPSQHPRSQPFIDHVINFAVTEDGNIWFRNYQIASDDSELMEVGPRFVLQPIRLFENSFCGTVLYDNPVYQTPNAIRRQIKLQKAGELRLRQGQREERKVKERAIRDVKMEDPLGEVFDTDVTMKQQKPGRMGGGQKKPSGLAKALEKRILKKNKKKTKSTS
uniref:Ribosome biogenesis protein BRX1 homolog n=1 Tax=Globodera pallida TaxID=36090 RepID=A0A183CCV6_GLOPA